jgi:hypothetical protein
MRFRPGTPAVCGVLAIAGLVIGCSAVTAPDYEGDAPLQTDRLEYQLQRDGEGALRVEIPFTYHNHTGKTVYLLNCNGDVSPSLQKWQGGEWVRAWSPIMLLCLSQPIQVAPDAVYEYTLHVFAAPRGSNTLPQFEVPVVDGTYRLVWHAPVHDYHSSPSTPLTLENRVSNNFRLRAP